MRTLTAFNFITLNGFYKNNQNDTSWHQHGAEESAYSAEMLSKENTLLFGRITYELMASFWPTEIGKQNDPVVAEGMSRAEKIVFSRTLTHADWENTRISGNLVETITQLKQSPGNNLAILGSGSLITQLTEARLIDEYQLMIDPLAIGSGTPFLSGISNPLHLQLTHSHVFRSGTVLLHYQPA